MAQSIFPDLLFTADRPENKISAETFDDLRLTALLPEHTLDDAGYLLGEEDIRARREVFSCLTDPGFRGRMQTLLSAAEELGETDALYGAARSDSERDVIYVTLASRLLAFYKAAAALSGSGELLSRFNSFFTAQTGMSWFDRTSSALENVLPMVTGLLKNRVCFITKGESIRVKDSPKSTYLQTIAECAEGLGLPRPVPDVKEANPLSMNIISGVVKALPDEFAAFAAFRKEMGKFYDRSVLSYIGQLRFYLGFASAFDRVTAAGIPLIFPTISNEKKIDVRSAYDITLLAKDDMKIIPNDILFTADEPFFYLTGANGGGKTTYLRAVGTTAVMFALGCPVACESAEMSIPDGIYTHFPRDERFDENGRFMDDQNRVDAILAKADGSSIVLLNETYSTTTEDIAVNLTSSLASRLYSTGVFGLYITHQLGISQNQIPYLNVVVDHTDANRRTYKVERRRADSSSYARDILLKYRLTREQLGERFGEV